MARKMAWEHDLRVRWACRIGPKPQPGTRSRAPESGARAGKSFAAGQLTLRLRRRVARPPRPMDGDEPRRRSGRQPGPGAGLLGGAPYGGATGGSGSGLGEGTRDLLGRREAGQEEAVADLVEAMVGAEALHPVTRGALVFHAWRMLGQDGAATGVEAVVLGARVSASTARAAFLAGGTCRI